MKRIKQTYHNKELTFQVYSKFLFLHTKTSTGVFPKRFTGSMKRKGLSFKQYHSFINILLSNNLIIDYGDVYRLVSKTKALGKRYRLFFRIESINNISSYRDFTEALFVSMSAEQVRRQQYMIRIKPNWLMTKSGNKTKYYDDRYMPVQDTGKDRQKLRKYMKHNSNRITMDVNPVTLTQRRLAKIMRIPQQTISNLYIRLKKKGVITYTQIRRRVKEFIPEYLMENGYFQNMYVYNYKGSSYAHFGCEVRITEKGKSMFTDEDVVKPLTVSWQNTHNRHNNPWLLFGKSTKNNRIAKENPNAGIPKNFKNASIVDMMCKSW